jgi:hypothetical protein
MAGGFELKFRALRTLALLFGWYTGIAFCTSASLTISGNSSVSLTDPTHYAFSATGTAMINPYGQSIFTSAGQVTVTPGGDSVQGTFTLDFGQGDTLLGTFTIPTGLVPEIGGSTAVSGTATITGGTGQFLGATGTFPTLTGTGTVTSASASSFRITGVGFVSTPATGGISGLYFVPITPCRIVDTRNPAGPFGGPTPGAGTQRNFALPSGGCGIPANALAYSLNVTAVPAGPLSYLTIWPFQQSQPLVSTLNSLDGRIKANAAIVPAGTNGTISVYVTNPTDVVLDINGYFVLSPATNLAFYPMAPCRVADTRSAAGAFGGPSLAAGQQRTFLVSQTCNIPPTAAAYSLNMTVVPAEPLAFLTAWPTGTVQPFVSTLNALTGGIVANAAIIPAGTNQGISVYATNTTDLVIDINGYFAPPGQAGALLFYPAAPCRLVDTRLPNGALGGPAFTSGATRNFPLRGNACGVPNTAQVYSLNATVVPLPALSFLTLWPATQVQPFVSTLNAPDGYITSNAALVSAGPDGSINAYTLGDGDLILDYNGYFAP